jgi:hypothetical protein
MNPLLSPESFNPLRPPNNNPLMMPGLPMPPLSPSLGFQGFASDPQNQHKIVPFLTAPDQPLQPNAPPQQPMASATPPRLNPVIAANANGQNPQAAPYTLSGPMALAIPNKTVPAQPMASAQPPPRAAMASVTPPGGFAGARASAQPAEPTNPLAWPQSANPMLPPTAQPNVQSQLGADQAKLQQLQTTGSGASQIKNPIGRGFAKAGDIALSILTPNAAPLIPGTTAHNRLLQQHQAGIVGQDQATLQAAQQSQTDKANLAKTQLETQQMPDELAIKKQAASLKGLQAQGVFAQHGLKAVDNADGTTSIAPDEDSPVYQKQQASIELAQSSVALKNAERDVENMKGDPNSVPNRLAIQRLQIAKQTQNRLTSTMGAMQERADAQMGTYLMRSKNVDLQGNTLAGAPIISDDDGQQSVVGTGNASLATKNQSNAAQFNDVHGALDNLEATARTLTASGEKPDSAILAAALAQPKGSIGQWLQGNAIKNNLSQAQRDYVTSLVQAHENIQALRKSAGGTATDSSVDRLEQMLPNASTPDLNYFLKQTGQIRSTAERLGKGATTATGGLKVRGQQNPMQPPPKQASGVSVTAPDGSTHTFKDQATANQFKALTGIK